MIDENMGEVVKSKIKCGEDVEIYPLAKIIKPNVVEIGEHSKVDDFTFIYGGSGIKIGRYVHIASVKLNSNKRYDNAVNWIVSEHEILKGWDDEVNIFTLK